MKQFVIRTNVRSPFQDVVSRFDENLFRALAPKFPRMQLLRHDPIQEGGEVHLLLNSGIMKQSWVSLLSQIEQSNQSFSFHDRGKKLPFPLKKWHHIHRVERHNGDVTTEIVDDIRFSTGWWLLDVLAKPVLYGLFSQRKHKYVAYFEQTTG